MKEYMQRKKERKVTDERQPENFDNAVGEDGRVAS